MLYYHYTDIQDSRPGRAPAAAVRWILMSRYRAAVFDMDGTVLDTLEDLRVSMNHVMAEAGHRHDFTPQDAAEFFGSGVEVAVRRALALEAGAERGSLEAIGTPGEMLPAAAAASIQGEAPQIQSAFRLYYSGHCDIETGPYEGILPLLEQLRAAGIRTAVVSNKPDNAVQKLCSDYFRGMFDICAGQREGVRRKPAPDMVTKVLRELGISSREAVYIGDSEIDLQTARNADMDCISVSWGFRSYDFLLAHGAGVIAPDPGSIAGLILS